MRIGKIICLAVIGLTAHVSADVRLPSFFSDHMVLQRNKPLPVWGLAEPLETVKVDFRGTTVDAPADAAGKWRVDLPAGEAGGPFELVVSGDSNTVTISDVLVGEVWLASGQSNMEWAMKQLGTPEGAADIAAADFSQIRQFQVARTVSHSEQSDVPGEWSVCSPERAGEFSAIGYYFAKEIHQTTGVPVGLLFPAYGGTDVEAWMPMAAMEQIPFMTNRLEVYRTRQANARRQAPFREAPEKLREDLKDVQWEVADPGNRSFFLGWAEAGFNDAAWSQMELPGEWEEKGLLIDGAVWFRKHVVIPSDWQGQDLTLELGRIDDFDTTYFNGIKVGATGKETPGAYSVARKYTIPASAVDAGKNNVITVRVFDCFRGGGFTGGERFMKIHPVDRAGEPVALYGAWRYKVAIQIPDLYVDPSSLQSVFAGNSSDPTVLYNGMIHGFIPYALRGVIWYQGENNCSRANEYSALFTGLIESWREGWGQGELPFFFVQLANYLKPQTLPCEIGSRWAVLREAQASALSLPNTGMAVITDTGEADNIHPRRKQPVGHRLALMARAQVYGESIPHRSPVLADVSPGEGQIVLRFEPAYDGLKTDDDQAVRGFCVMDEQGSWSSVKGTIQGDCIVLEAAAGPFSEVRYNWADNPFGNVVNSAGLPLSLFRVELR